MFAITLGIRGKGVKPFVDRRPRRPPGYSMSSSFSRGPRRAVAVFRHRPRTRRHPGDGTRDPEDAVRPWLGHRDAVTKAFALGPALAVVAARTTARPLAHAARSAALRLSRDVGYAGSVVERFGNSSVVTSFRVTRPRSRREYLVIASRTRRRSGSHWPPGTRKRNNAPGSGVARVTTPTAPFASNRFCNIPASAASTSTGRRRRWRRPST